MKGQMGAMRANMNMKALQAIIEAEPKSRKRNILIGSLTLLVICIVFFGLYIARLVSVGNIQTIAED